MYTNSESIPYYFKYLEYSFLNVTFWPIIGEDNIFIKDLKKLNCDLHEYITCKQVSIYVWGQLSTYTHIHLEWLIKYLIICSNYNFYNT